MEKTGKLKTNNAEELDLSVVLPVFNEEKNVGKLVDELVKVLSDIGLSFEILAVNVDGKDRSYEVLRKLGEKYPEVFPINARYLKTQGYQKGYQYMLGFTISRGKRVIQMDSDYQDDPKDIPRFLNKLDEGFDVVVGWKQDRKDPFFYTLTSNMQNFLTRIISGVQLHDKNCGFKAYERSAVDSLNLYGMNYRDIPLQLSVKGFRVTEIPINNRKRIGGSSNFTFFNRLLGGTLDFIAAVISAVTLDKPFRIIGGFGIFKLIIGIGMFLFWILWLFVFGHVVGFSWWVVAWILTSFIMIVTGAIYLAAGIIMEYFRSLQRFSLDDVYVVDDAKGRVS